MRIEKSDFGYWVYFKHGRAKFVDFDSEMGRRISLGEAIDGIEKRRRSEKHGHIEPVVYYRDEDGNIGVPPEPNVLPEGCTPMYATSLQEIDKLSSEMRAQFRDTWKDDGFTGEMEEMLGRPRKELVREMENATPYGREVIRGLLAHLDQEEADRNRVTAETFFHAREYDQ